MQGSNVKPVVVDLARELVGRMAPEELPFFQAASAVYLNGPEGTLVAQEPQDERFSFDAGEVVTWLTPVIMAVSAGVVTSLMEELKSTLQEGGERLIAERVRRLFKRSRAAEQQEEQPPHLTPEQLRRVREVAIQKARQLDLPEDRAHLLADAVVGSLAAGAG